MSKDTPEVGDVWESNRTLIYLEQVGEKYDKEAVYCFVKFKNRVKAYSGIYTKSYIKRKMKYLGKSKANIDDLFEVQDNKPDFSKMTTREILQYNIKKLENEE